MILNSEIKFVRFTIVCFSIVCFILSFNYRFYTELYLYETILSEGGTLDEFSQIEMHIQNQMYPGKSYTEVPILSIILLPMLCFPKFVFSVGINWMGSLCLLWLIFVAYIPLVYKYLRRDLHYSHIILAVLALVNLLVLKCAEGRVLSETSILLKYEPGYYLLVAAFMILFMGIVSDSYIIMCDLKKSFVVWKDKLPLKKCVSNACIFKR